MTKTSFAYKSQAGLRLTLSLSGTPIYKPELHVTWMFSTFASSLVIRYVHLYLIKVEFWGFGNFFIRMHKKFKYIAASVNSVYGKKFCTKVNK